MDRSDLRRYYAVLRPLYSARPRRGQRGRPYDNTIVKVLDNTCVNGYRGMAGRSNVRSRQDDRPVYVISVAADLAGLHPRTLRIYEEKGLVHPARRNNTRLYSDRDLERVRLIRHLTQELGLNLAGVRVLLDVYERLEYRGSGDSIGWIFERTVRRRRVR